MDTTSKWVQSIRSAYDDLPSRLTAEFEIKHLQVLEDWTQRVQVIREAYENGEVEEPDDHLPGGSQVVPALASVQGMSEEELDALYRLFACSAPQLADLAYRYWSSYNPPSQSLELPDLLDYLPVIFTSVLSVYDPTRTGNEHEDDFSESDDRIRLSTWIHWSAPRHIKTYLQGQIHTVRQGSGMMHRLRHHVNQVQNEMYNRTGRRPSRSQIADEIQENWSYANRVQRETLEDNISIALSGTTSRSLSDTVGPDHEDDESFTYEDMINNRTAGIGSIYDPITALFETIDDESKRSGVEKILACDEMLTTNERFVLGL